MTIFLFHHCGKVLFGPEKNSEKWLLRMPQPALQSVKRQEMQLALRNPSNCEKKLITLPSNAIPAQRDFKQCECINSAGYKL